jgi:hypothetical protein
VKSVLRILVTMTCLLPWLWAAALAQQQPSRLLVTNKTGTTVELFAFVQDNWQSRGRISAGSSMPVYNVANGQRFRAVWGSRAKELVIKLAYDRTYGGWQQEWELPGQDTDRQAPTR